MTTNEKSSRTFRKLASVAIILIGAVMIIVNLLLAKEKTGYVALLSGVSLVVIGGAVLLGQPAYKSK